MSVSEELKVRTTRAATLFEKLPSVENCTEAGWFSFAAQTIVTWSAPKFCRYGGVTPPAPASGWGPPPRRQKTPARGPEEIPPRDPPTPAPQHPPWLHKVDEPPPPNHASP